MTTGIIFDIKKFSLHDGPGIRTTVFLKGCSLRCRWCHNPESQDLQPELIFRPHLCIQCGACLPVCASKAVTEESGTISYHMERCTACGACAEACYTEAREMVGRKVTVPEVVAEIDKDRPFYEESAGGVTFSGGEPLMQRDFLLAMLRACRHGAIHTTVDTCGFVPWETFESLREYVDLFLYDLKLMDDAEHRKYTGVSNELIIKNLKTLSQRGHDIIIRVPIVPGITDGEENIRQIGAIAAGLATMNRLHLLPYYHIAGEKYRRLGRTYDLAETRPPSEHSMAKAADILRGYGLEVTSGG